MPLWVLLVLAGIVLSVLGFAGLGNIALWVGLALVVSGLVASLVGWSRRDRRPVPDTRPARTAVRRARHGSAAPPGWAGWPSA